MKTLPLAHNIIAWSVVAGVMVMTAVGVAESRASTGNSDADGGEIIPGGDEQLTQDELRWCVFESARLDGEREALDTRKVWEIESYSVRSQTYQKRCSDKTYRERDKAAVDDEMTSAKRLALRQQGAGRVAAARAEREERRVHVKEHVARILAAPEHTAAELGRLAQWGDLVATGNAQGPWREVEWPAASPRQPLAFGWVLGGLLGPGPGPEARYAYCEQRAGERANHNEVVRREIDLHTISAFNVENGLKDSAYVKLIRENDQAVVSMFVAAEQTATLRGIPSGSYEIVFATGSNFSRGCDSFSQRGAAQRFSESIDYGHRAVVWTVSLHSVSDGNAQANSISYDDFDRL